MWNLNIWILVTIFTCTYGYNRKCPHTSQWNFTSRCTDQKIHICLFNAIKSNGSKAVFTDSCSPEDLARDGFRYILTPDLHQVPCAAIRYQPFTFTTNGNSRCVLSKSLCKANGQVLANNGNSSIDASCRCDYRQNYDYIIPPKDPCTCKPAEEDCSCYIRKCEDDKVMIADYRCMKNVGTILPEDIKCPIFSRIAPPEEPSTVNKIQLQPVTGSRTWSKQASVILIVVVFIFTVLIGFLFFSVPYVTSILLKSKFELAVKKDNEFMILNGDNVKIECNIKSYIRVHSVTWQKEIKGEIKQIPTSEEKYKMNYGKRPSLSLTDFNADDEGKYRCIVRNVIGLRNGLFSSCMNHMSRFGWLTGFVSVLQHIPTFHTEDITLHTYNIDPQLKPTVYHVYKGNNITMEQHYNDQQKLITVKWFKGSDKLKELDLGSEQYSGGVPDVPSLTIKNTGMQNAGKYFCLLNYDNGETQKALFKLTIRQEIYKALLDHREDETFLRPAICDTLDKQLRENNIVVISGREGTGKSKICLELASIYDEKDYMVLKVDLSENYRIYTEIVDALIIIDYQHYTLDTIKPFMKHLLPVIFQRNIKVILTCRNLDLDIVRSVPEINELKSEAFIDIDNFLTAEEKEEMLKMYMKVNNITSLSYESNLSYENNLMDPKIVTDLSTLDNDAIRVIANEEPWNGFPLCVSLFCSKKEFLLLGEKYFTNPPRCLFIEMKKLFKTAKTSHCIITINEYCILAYILKNSYHQLDLNDSNICKEFFEMYQAFEFKPEKPGSNEDQKEAIEKAVHRLNNKYLKLQDGMYKLISPCLLKAVFMSTDSMVNYQLEIGPLLYITEFVRSNEYTGSENELIIRIDKENHHILSERLVKLAFESQLTLQQVAQYIYKHWHAPEIQIELVNEIFCLIENIIFESLGVHTGNHPEIDSDSVYKDSTKVEDQITFSKVTMLVDELTCNGKDPWIYRSDTINFIILSGLVTAAKGKYGNNGYQTFKIMLSEFQRRMQSEKFVKLRSEPLDIYGNTFFHFLMLFNELEVCKILSEVDLTKIPFDTANVKKYSPLDIAAYLGKKNILEVLRTKTNCIKKVCNRLKRLAECGKIEYYKETSNKKNIDQSLVDKTKIDSSLPEKFECEDADGKKKKVKDESKTYLSIITKAFSLGKAEPSNDKEKHDKKDVLYFEDFMILSAKFGKEEDYESIINLLSS